MTDAADMARRAADLIEQALGARRPVIGLAAGNTPRATYAELVRRHRTGGLRFDHAQYVLLDEYAGLPADHPACFRNDIIAALTSRVGVPAQAVHAPMCAADRLDVAARRYESLLAELGPRSIQVLGIGRNGHIGFNEPGTDWDSRTHVARLRPETRSDNAAAFAPDDVPTHAVTMGIATILEADRMLLLATGTSKARAIAATVDGPVDARTPASALQRHPDVTLLLDRDAARDVRGV